MTSMKVKYIIVSITIAITASFVAILKYDNTSIDNESFATLQGIPLRIDNWEGRDFPLDEQVYSILETRAIIHRSFISNSGENVFLSIVHYNDTKVDFHAPEACLGGRGLKTTKNTKTIKFFSGKNKRKIDVAEIITTKQIGKTLTYYFFKSGNFLGSNYIKMRLCIAKNKLTNNDTRGSLIRISTNVSSSQEAAGELRLISFLEDLYPYIQKSL